MYGDGPERSSVVAAIAEHGLEGIVDAPGFVDSDVIDGALAHALCLLLPSRREGYGLVVLEAMSRGTPVVLVRGEDNAAAEFVEAGKNGFVASSASADDLAAAVLQVHTAGPALRSSTLEWFRGHAGRLGLDGSLERVAAAYEAR